MRIRVARKHLPALLTLGGGLALWGCGKTNFGDTTFQSDTSAAPAANGQGADASKNSANESAYGTPPTSVVDKSGWITKEISASVDGLLVKGELPSGDPGPGGSGNDPSNPGATPGGGPNGGAGQPPGPGTGIVSQTDGVLWLTCNENGADAGTFTSEFFGKKGSKVRVAGEFCPTAKVKGDVTVLFLIDHSGSMEGAPNEGPNDKTSNGSCGRLRAAEAVVNSYAKLQEVNVNAGVIGFSTIARPQVPVVGLNQLKGALRPDVFCGSDGPFAFTNYNAALLTAAAQLASVPGQKVVYLISDGSPTVGGPDPQQAGLAAANTLRSIPDTSLYALFVGYKGGQTDNPRGYLDQLTGNPNLVRVTSNAAELTKAAKSLGTIPIKIEAKDTKATLENPAGLKDIAIESLAQRKDAPDRYIWRSEPFELTGADGAATLNKFTITTVTARGDKLTTVADITFHQRP